MVGGTTAGHEEVLTPSFRFQRARFDRGTLHLSTPQKHGTAEVAPGDPASASALGLRHGARCATFVDETFHALPSRRGES